MTTDARTGWMARPVVARLIQAAAVLTPIVAGFAASALVARSFVRSPGWMWAVAWWAAVILAGVVVVVVIERLTRRLLPLAHLLQLTLVFPDATPARVRVASHAGRTRALQQAVEEARREGLSSEPARAAEQVVTLIAALGVHDRRTRGHAERVRVFADLVGQQMQLSEEDTMRLRWASLLHDVGKLAVPSEILNKPGKPDAEEWAILKSHPSRGREFAGPLLGFLGEWAHAIDHHHERWDGSGYPNGLVGEDIGLAGRIIGVADAFEVITAARAYKKPLSVTAARHELVRCAGTHFDPQIVRHFLDIAVGTLSRQVGLVAWFLSLPIVGSRWFRDSGDDAPDDTGSLGDEEIRDEDETKGGPEPPSAAAAPEARPLSSNGDGRERRDSGGSGDSGMDGDSREVEPVADERQRGLPPADAVATWSAALSQAAGGDTADPVRVAAETPDMEPDDPFAFGSGARRQGPRSGVPANTDADIGGFGSGGPRTDALAHGDDATPTTAETDEDSWATTAFADVPWEVEPMHDADDDAPTPLEIAHDTPDGDDDGDLVGDIEESVD